MRGDWASVSLNERDWLGSGRVGGSRSESPNNSSLLSESPSDGGGAGSVVNGSGSWGADWR